MRKLVSALLTMVLLFTSFTVMPVTSVLAEGESTHSLTVGEVGDDVYVSDENMLDSWKTMFTDTSTEYAGAVWTDKTVFTSAVPNVFKGLNAAVIDSYSNGEITMGVGDTPINIDVADGNFLVSLSALGSTKQISGYSTLPSDTVLILDLSNSMGESEMRAMVKATNNAIHRLLSLNNYNRVGVAVYSTDAYELLPIDRYTTTSIHNNGTVNDTSDDYPEYIELVNFSVNNNANSGQIRAKQSVTTNTSTQTISLDLSGVTAGQWSNLVKEINDISIWEQNRNRKIGEEIRSWLSQVRVTVPTDVEINWTNIARGKDNRGWEAYLKDALTNISVTSSSTVYTYYVKNSENADVTTSRNIGGATYIQGGLGVALNMFEEIEDTSIETGLIQGGTKRIPITVLMTDGAPTYASTNYTDPTNNSRNVGSGGNTSINDYTVFPTQLTAALLKKTVEEHYNNDSLFYSLGLGIEYDEALRVLNPAHNTNATINTYWTNYELTAKGFSIFGYTSIERAEDADSSLDTHRYYTDEYFPASNADGLINAFASIVETIIIQSKYYPTLVESGRYDMDGYITFEDELGEFMQVADLEGMIIGDTLYSGEAFIYALKNTNAFGNQSQWTEYGNELMTSIAERIGIEENEARSLLAAAWRAGNDAPNQEDGQLHTENYIGWYADAAGKYLGHWDDEIHTSENYPKDAKYLNKSYIFQGELDDEYGNLNGSDMMHIVVQVHEEIETGNQCVIWKVPASLVPLVTYTITVDSDNLDDAEVITMERTPESEINPIRLLFEVELDPEINEVNLLDKVGAHSHNHPVYASETDKTIVGYAFYSNRWGTGHQHDGSGDTDVFDPNNRLATVSHFHPSVQNERYMFEEDSIIFVKDGENYVEYENLSAPTASSSNENQESGYYYEYIVFKKNGENVELIVDYLPIDNSIIVEAESLDEGNGWYIPAGNIHKAVARYRVIKNNNITGTLDYYDYPVVTANKNISDYNIYNFLGNNGRLVMYSAQGIKLSKEINAANPDSNAVFSFEVQLTGENLASSYKSLKLNATGAETEGTATVNNGKITVELKDGETIYILGLPAGTSYTVSEAYHDEYRVEEVTVNGIKENGNIATDTIDQYVVDAVHFVNAPSSHKGNLEVSKIAKVDTNAYGNDYTLDPTLTFDVFVELPSIAEGTVLNVTGTVNNGAPISSVNVGAGNKVHLKFGHDDSVLFKDLPENITYTVTETIDTNTGWQLKTDAADLTGTIISDATVYAELENELHVKSTVDTTLIDIQVIKYLEGIEWANLSGSFDFVIKRYDNGSWVDIDKPEAVTISNSSDDVTVDGKTGKAVTILGKTSTDEVRREFDKLGTYYYGIAEVIPEDANKINGITYDSTYAYFYVVITDKNSDGVLELDVQPYNNTTTVNKDGNKYTVTADFTNFYASAVETIQVKKNLSNHIEGENTPTGIEIPMNSFTFELCDGTHDNNGNCSHVNTYTPNIAGELRVQEVYTENMLNDVTVWTYVDASSNTSSTYDEDVQGVPEGATKSKVFTYHLSEVAPADAIPGMTYDPVQYVVEVTVTVTKGSNNNSITTSQVIKKVEGQNTSEVNSIEFNNKYMLKKDNHLTLSIPVHKELTGGLSIPANTFSIELHKTASNFATSDSTLINKDSNNAVPGGSTTGSLTFGLPTMTQAGTYYYVVKETPGTLTGVTYDSSVYHISIVVDKDDQDLDEDGENGELIITSVTINKVGNFTKTFNSYEEDVENSIPDLQKNDSSLISFVNNYQVRNGVSVVIGADKELVGKAIAEDEFKFELYKDGNPTETVYASAVSGAINFSPLDYTASDLGKTYSYQIKEVVPPGLTLDSEGFAENSDGSKIKYDTNTIDFTVQIHDNDMDGNLNAVVTMGGKDVTSTSSNLGTFNNVYKPAPVEVSFSGTKTYVDKNNQHISDWPEFEFVLYKTDKNFSTLSESPVETSVISSGNYVNKVVPFAFDLEYSEAGTHYYILREMEGDTPSVRYDSKEYHVTVIITDYNDGVLVPTISVTHNGQNVNPVPQSNEKPNIYFANRLVEQEIDTDIKITKQFTNPAQVDIPMSDFKFGVYTDVSCDPEDEYKVNGQHLVAVADDDGNASIHFHFTNEDMGNGNEKVIKLYVKEMNPTDPEYAIEYDKSVYEVVINLFYDDLDGDNVGETLASSVTSKKVSTGNTSSASEGNVPGIVFENKLELSEVALELFASKELNRDIVDTDEFKVEFYNASVSVDAATNEEIWTVGNPVDPANHPITNTDTPSDTDEVKNEFVLPKLEYQKVGAYHYILKEVDVNAGGMTYDETEYRISVKVEPGDSDTDPDYSKDSLVVTDVKVVKVLSDGTSELVTEDELVFSNTYATSGKIDFNLLPVEKELNRLWNENDVFVFELYEASMSSTNHQVVLGDKIDTVEISKDDATASNDFVDHFSKVETFDAEGTYYYVVKEVKGNRPNVTYDDTQYLITVTTVDEGHVGELKVTSTISKLAGNSSSESIVFSNTYDADDVKVLISGKKSLVVPDDVSRSIKDGEFEFGLFTSNDQFDDIAPNHPAFTGKNKNNSFEVEAEFDSAGTYYFLLKEVKGNIPTIKYSEESYPVRITVTDNYDTGKLEAKTEYYVNGAWTETLAEDIVFTNEFHPTEVTIAIEKELKFTSNGKHGLSGFVFALEEDGDTAVAISGDDGKAEFILQFDERHVDKSFKFVVSEASQKEKDMVYDTTKHEIELEVKVNSEGKLIVTKKDSDVAVSKIDLTFTNTFNGSEDVPEKPVDPTPSVVVPNTGDDSNVPLYGAMMLICALLMAILFVVQKKRELASRH